MKKHVLGTLLCLLFADFIFASTPETGSLLETLAGQKIENVSSYQFTNGALVSGCIAAKIAKNLMTYKNSEVEGNFPAEFYSERVCAYSNLSSTLSLPVIYKQKLYKVTCYPGTSLSEISCSIEEQSKKAVLTIE